MSLPQVDRGRRKNILSFQWHLTDRCNWRCKHCYAESYSGSELSLAELKRVFLEYIALLKQNNSLGRLNLTGGEPFVREDFLDFLEFVAQYRQYLSKCNILTNGSLLTPEILQRIKTKAWVSNIQISVEGPEIVNDAIRGEGSFAKILEALSLVKSVGIITHLATTVSRLNFRQVFDLLDLLLIYDVPLFLRRFVPMGSGAKIKKMLLTPAELRDFYHRAAKLNQQYHLKNGGEVFYSNLCSNGLKYIDWPEQNFPDCGVRGAAYFALMPDGTMYPCRLVPIALGNVRQKSLLEIHQTERRDFTQHGKYSLECQSCALFARCRAGAACVAYAVTGDPFATDPQCFKKCLKK